MKLYLLKYKTTFDNNKNWKFKIFKSYESATKYHKEYFKGVNEAFKNREMTFRITHFDIIVLELDKRYEK